MKDTLTKFAVDIRSDFNKHIIKLIDLYIDFAMNKCCQDTLKQLKKTIMEDKK